MRFSKLISALGASFAIIAGLIIPSPGYAADDYLIGGIRYYITPATPPECLDYTQIDRRNLVGNSTVPRWAGKLPVTRRSCATLFDTKALRWLDDKVMGPWSQLETAIWSKVERISMPANSMGGPPFVTVGHVFATCTDSECSTDAVVLTNDDYAVGLCLSSARDGWTDYYLGDDTLTGMLYHSSSYTSCVASIDASLEAIASLTRQNSKFIPAQ